MPPDRRHRHLPPAYIAIVAATVSMMLPDSAPNDLLASLALCTTIVAAIEGRSRATILAAGIAAGLAPIGLAPIPLAIGFAIRRRMASFLPIGLAIGLATYRLTDIWHSAGSIPSFTTLAMQVPQFAILIAATGLGLAAWIAATTSVRGTSLRAPLIGTLALMTFLPLTMSSFAPPLLLAIGLGWILRRPPVAANDNPFYPRYRTT